jgi:acetyl esterase/lipase
MGNSAGGNLTASLSLLLSFTEGPCAKFRNGLPENFSQKLQILLYPSVELFNPYGTRLRRCSPDVQAKSLPAWMAELMEASYCPPYINKSEIFVSPLLVDEQLLKELKVPPAMVITAGMDCLKDEANQYVTKLKGAGVDVQTKDFPLAVHGFSHFTETSSQKDDYRPRDVEECWSLIVKGLQNAFT